MTDSSAASKCPRGFQSHVMCACKAACKHTRIDVQRLAESERQVACHECAHVFVVIPDAAD